MSMHGCGLEPRGARTAHAHRHEQCRRDKGLGRSGSGDDVKRLAQHEAARREHRAEAKRRLCRQQTESRGILRPRARDERQRNEQRGHREVLQQQDGEGCGAVRPIFPALGLEHGQHERRR